MCSLFEYVYRLREALAIRRARIAERHAARKRLRDVKRMEVPEVPR